MAIFNSSILNTDQKFILLWALATQYKMMDLVSRTTAMEFKYP